MHHDSALQTLIACMSIDGGPDGCCGCMNMLEGPSGWEIFCNECERTVSTATPMPMENEHFWRERRQRKES